MYKKADGPLVFSPSDLTVFLDSNFSSWMDRYILEKPDCGIEPDPEDPLNKVLQSRGYRHEENEIERLMAEGRSLVRISSKDKQQQMQETVNALRLGEDVVFQARLEKSPFSGIADFLVKVPCESKLGNYHYEVWDTKLSGKLKGHFSIQLCAYTEMLEGIAYLPVRHEGNSQASEEEVDAIVKLSKRLFLQNIITEGKTRSLSWEDILFVAPYNFQVRKLQEALGEQARVGSVDKFQGQEAPVVVMSMRSSNLASGGRGLDFLFSKNRLNVAISRAQVLAILVGHPDLVMTPAHGLEDMALVNFYADLLSKAERIDFAALEEKIGVTLPLHPG